MKPITYVLIIAGFFCFFLVAFNIYVTQDIHPLFLKMATEGNIHSAEELLGALDHTEFFTSQLAYFNEQFGPEIQNKLARGEMNKKRQQQDLQSILERNPDSTTALLNLSINNYDEGNFATAINYYQQAKKVDPWIKIDALERLIKNN